MTSSFEASTCSAIFTLALILRGRAGNARPVLAIDGKENARGKDYRTGQGATVDSIDLILWFGFEAEQPLTVTIGAEVAKPKAQA